MKKENDLTEQTSKIFKDIYLTYDDFEGYGDQLYIEGDYECAEMYYSCELKILLMRRDYLALHCPNHPIVEGDWEAIQIARLKLLLSRYHKVLHNWEKNNSVDEFLADVIKRGLWLCRGNNADVNVLVTGINPSFTGFSTEPKPNEFEKWHHHFPMFVECKGGHWNPILKIVANQFRVNHPHVWQAAYLDLFPLRVSSQNDMVKIPVELRAELLRITQMEIERLKPKLILHLNGGKKGGKKGSWFYWGYDKENPWMGYDLELVEEYQGKGELYRIRGMQDTDKKILPLSKTNLEGSLLLLYKSQTPRGRLLPREELLTEEDVRQIFINHYKE